MLRKAARIVYVVVVAVLFLVGMFMYESEEFDRVIPLSGDGEYLVHGEQLVPREEVDILIAEDGKLYLFYIDAELVNVYSDSGEFLYGLQFPDAQNDASDMTVKDGLLYVDARLSGIYVFRDTELIRFELQHYQNEGHDELEKVFTGAEDHTDGDYTYSYLPKDNQIVRRGDGEFEMVLQFPARLIDAQSHMWIWLVLIIVGKYLWSDGKIPAYRS